jgi:DNA-binding response OmpR family regulator
MPNKKSILLVEDDKNLNQINRLALEADGYNIYSALSLKEARECLAKHIPDLILLDVKLPDGTGFVFCREIRGQSLYAAIPILFLTSVTDQTAEMEGLRSGGNDYLRKPYSIELLRVRVANLLKLRDSQPVRDITLGPLTMKVKTTIAYLHGKNMGLKPKEFALLLAFMENEGRVMSTKYIYETVWEAPMVDDNRTLKKHVSDLRRKLGDENSGYTIKSVYGEGYRFDAEQ